MPSHNRAKPAVKLEHRQKGASNRRDLGEPPSPNMPLEQNQFARFPSFSHNELRLLYLRCRFYLLRTLMISLF